MALAQTQSASPDQAVASALRTLGTEREGLTVLMEAIGNGLGPLFTSAVETIASAKGRVIGVAIDDSLLVPADKGILEDLVAAAFNDARSKADAVSGDEMARMQQGMGLPPGFNLPGM